jgi:putative transposase
VAVAATPASPVGSWSSEAKFAAVVETARLNELELGEYCRHKGLFAEQIGVWRETCRQANAALPTKAERAQRRAEREQVQYLTRELQRKDRALAEAAALLVLQKKTPGALGGARGRSLPQERRVAVSAGIAQAGAAGARLERACAVAGLSLRTLQRWHREGALKTDGRRREHRPEGAQRTPANRLSSEERDQILEVANTAQFAHLSPHQIVPALAPTKVATWPRRRPSTASCAPPTSTGAAAGSRARARPTPLAATGPNQVWSWDIAYPATTVRGAFFYLYPIMDLYSRKIVGWEVYAEESAAHAATVFHKAHLREGVGATALVLHSDNGAPMKGATMLATLQRLGVVPSFSRPAVSNDNPQLPSPCSTPSKATQASPSSLSIPRLPHAPGWLSSSPGITATTITARCGSSPPRNAIAGRTPFFSPSAMPSTRQPGRNIPNAGAARPATGNPPQRSSSTQESRPPRGTTWPQLPHDQCDNYLDTYRPRRPVRTVVLPRPA